MKVVSDEVCCLLLAVLSAVGGNSSLWLQQTLIDAGAPTVNKKFGTKVAVLVGDFLFAQSSWFLAQLDNLEVRFHQMLLLLVHKTLLQVDHFSNGWFIVHIFTFLDLYGAGNQAYQSSHC